MNGGSFIESLKKIGILIIFLTANVAAAEYRLLEMYVSPDGSENASGTESDPINSLQEAQRRADEFISTLDPNGLHKDDYIKVRINLSGVFTCQTFQWDHSHQSVHLHMRPAPGKYAEFNGHREGCYNSGPNGLVFFGAWGNSSDLKAYKGYSGYGSITIHNLVIKHYGSAINVSAWEDIKPGAVAIKNNVFYNIGQIVAPDQWDPRYTVIKLQSVDGAEIINNRFIKIGNVVDTALMHGVYIINSDRNLIEGNHFESISGPPIKFRNSSDKNRVIGNTFLRGDNSTHRFPIQNWYANWWMTDEEAGPDRELPSFGNTLENNTYDRGYIDYPISYQYEMRKSICANRIVATPDQLPQSYIDAGNQQGTNSRFIVRGEKVYGVHWVQLNCSEFNGVNIDDL